MTTTSKTHIGQSTPVEVNKPWGSESIWAKTKDYVGKILSVKKDHALSLQYHEQKTETMIILSGKIQLLYLAMGTSILDDVLGVSKDPTELIKGQEAIVLTAGDTIHLPPRTLHKVLALEDTTILEVSTPQLEDVVRVQDNYGRK